MDHNATSKRKGKGWPNMVKELSDGANFSELRPCKVAWQGQISDNFQPAILTCVIGSEDIGHDRVLTFFNSF